MTFAMIVVAIATACGMLAAPKVDKADLLPIGDGALRTNQVQPGVPFGAAVQTSTFGGGLSRDN
jgi:hypothetical protein